jgi:acetyltransferase-like isoleucine patch superfamily enzyme
VSLPARIRRLVGSTPAADRRGIGSVEIGEHSYGFTNVLTWQRTDLVKVGRYSSAAPGVTLVAGGNHPTNIATFPFRSRLIGGDWYQEDATASGPIVIGHDVWIGHGAIILSGANIGHGSIVGAGAVVRGAFEPYSVILGNPAESVKQRFDAAVVQQLLAIAWWDWSNEKVVECTGDFYGSIDAFLAKHG